MTGRVLVTGATGTVGGLVLARLREQGVPLRALTRDPAAAALGADVETAPGAPGDTTAMTAALRGIEGLFVVLVGDVATAAAGLAPALRDADGLRRVVMLSSASVEHPVPHAIGRDHRAAEEAVAVAFPGATFLRPGPFHSNALWWARAVRGTGRVRCLIGNRPGAPVDPGDVADAAARLLVEDGHEGCAYEVTGPQTLTSGDQARILALAAGRPIGFDVAPEAEAVDTFTAIGGDRAAAEGNVAALRSRDVPWAHPTDVLPRLLGRAPRRFHDWAAEHADAFR